MRKLLGLGMAALLASGLGGTSLAVGQAPPGGSELERLESGIRSSGGQPAPIAASQRAYLGAVGDDDAGRGVRVLSVRKSGPADQAGLRTNDLVIAAAGHKIGSLADLTTILSNLNPGNRMVLDVLRGNRQLHMDVLLSELPGTATARRVAPPAPGIGRTDLIPLPPADSGSHIPPPPADATSHIPPPPADASSHIPPPPGNPGLALPPPAQEGPMIALPNPQPAAANAQQAQIDELRRRVEELERKVQSLERALAETGRK
jgi:hypothetical protein